MGLNIAGLAIDHNFNREIERLGEALEWGIEIVEEIDFEEASLNDWSKKKEFNVYFSDQGALLFFPYEWAMDDPHSINSNSLCFLYATTSMSFMVSFQDAHSNHRYFMEMEGKKNSEKGSPLSLEKEVPSADELIMKLIEDLLGESFHSIEMDAKAYRCRKLSQREYMRLSESKLQKEMELAKQEDEKRTRKYMEELGMDYDAVEAQLNQKKKWWAFWK